VLPRCYSRPFENGDPAIVFREVDLVAKPDPHAIRQLFRQRHLPLGTQGWTSSVRLPRGRADAARTRCSTLLLGNRLPLRLFGQPPAAPLKQR